MHRNSTRRGFTLIELLVVISLLVLLLAMALPAFNYITGARSIEAARNITNAMLSRARVAALVSKDPATGERYTVGVMFFVDPATQKTTLVTVRYTTTPKDETLRYKSYSNAATYLGPDPNPPATPYRDRSDAPDKAIFITKDYTPAGVYNAEGGRPMVKTYVRKSPVPYGRNPLSGTSPPVTNQPANSVAYTPAESLAAEGWIELADGNLELASLTPALQEFAEIQTLPGGVGVQILIDNDGVVGNERYLRTGAILFDPQGRLTVKPLAVSALSQLGESLGMYQLTQSIPLAAKWKSGLGVAFYDQQTFLGKGFTEGDMKIQIPGLKSYQDGVELGVGSEEEWIDQDAEISLVNRTTGTLMVNQ